MTRKTIRCGLRSLKTNGWKLDRKINTRLIISLILILSLYPILVITHECTHWIHFKLAEGIEPGYIKIFPYGPFTNPLGLCQYFKEPGYRLNVLPTELLANIVSFTIVLIILLMVMKWNGLLNKRGDR